MIFETPIKFIPEVSNCMAFNSTFIIKFWQGCLAVFRFHGKFYKPVTHTPPPHPPPLYGGICDIDCARLKTIYNGGQFN